MDSEVICEQHNPKRNVKADNRSDQFVNRIGDLTSPVHQY